MGKTLLLIALILGTYHNETLAAEIDTPVDWEERGQQLFDEKKFGPAVRAFSKAIDLDPSYALAYRRRGASYHELGDYQAAFMDYQKALELDPDEAMTYNNIGVLFAEFGRFEQAAQAYDMALKLDPNLAMAYANRGRLRKEMNDDEGALSDLNKALELEPGDASGFNARGIFFAKKGMHAEALKDYETALKIDPDYAFAYHNRANLYVRLSDFDKATDDYTKALSIRRFPAAYAGRGEAFLFRKKYEEAIEDLSQAIEMKPNYASAYRNRAETFEALGKPQDALKDYERAVRIDPKDAASKARIEALKRRLAYPNDGGMDLVEGKNILRNPGAEDEAGGWQTYGDAAVEEWEGGKRFVVRSGGAFYQVVDIPDARGWYAVYVARASANTIPRPQPDHPPVGLPRLLGQLELAGGKHVAAHMRGRTMEFAGKRAREWVPLWGIYPIEKEGQRIQFRMCQTEFGTIPLTGSVSRFDDAGLYFFKTEAAAKDFVVSYQAKVNQGH